MFIKRNFRRRGDAEPTSILLVQGVRVPVGKRPRGRPPKDAPPPRTKVVHKVLANLTKLPLDLVALIETYARDEQAPQGGDEVCVGPCYGQLGALRAIAAELGIASVLGSSRMGRLALFLVLARVAHQGSRLSSVRWAEDQAVDEVLGTGRFDEDDLYAALDWLEEEHERIEIELARTRAPTALYLYDVTSSYFEGEKNELAAPGYNRDGKKYKKQVVVGLLTDASGDPVAVRVYPGNTCDPTTVAEPVRFLADEIGAEDVVFVGDRGMVKSKPKSLLSSVGFRYLTALNRPQIRSLLKKGVIQMDLFDEEVAEVCPVERPWRRLILRRNHATRERDRHRRADQFEKVERKLAERNEYVLSHSRAKPETSLKETQKRLAAYRLDRFVEARLEGRRVKLVVDPEKKAEVELLDGCYVLETDVPCREMDAETGNARYMDLTRVERDFRTMKTAALEIRPIFLRKANRTRAHALVTMLALKLIRALEDRVKDLGITAEDAIDRLAGVRLVTMVDPALALWRLPTRHAAPQQQILDRLPPLPVPVLSRTRPKLVPA